jgi:hypothetical protein
MSTNQINGFLFPFFFLHFHWVYVRCCCWWRQLTITQLGSTTTGQTHVSIYQHRYSNESRWPDQSSVRGAQLRPEGVPARPAQAGRKHPSANPCQRKQRIQGTAHIDLYSVYNSTYLLPRLYSMYSFLGHVYISFVYTLSAFEAISKELIRK